MKIKRRVYVLAFVLLSAMLIITSCSKNTGILFKIFNVSYKAYEPLDPVAEKIYKPLLGEYILANERALIISEKDSNNYSIKFLPEWISEEPKILNGYITTLNNRKYLNVYTDDDNFLIFRIDQEGDSVAMKLLTHNVNTYAKGLTLKDYLKKDGNIQDTSSALFRIPSKHMATGAAEKWSSDHLKAQVRDIESYYRYQKLFPADTCLVRLKKSAIDMSMSKTNSVVNIYNLMQKYPEAKEAGMARAMRVCTSTKNCLDYISYFPQEAMRDSVVDKAFIYSKTEEDYKTLIGKFPDHKMTTVVMGRLFYEEKRKCKSPAELDALKEKYAGNNTFLKLMKSFRDFEKIPFDSIQFNSASYILTKNSKPVLDRIMLYISESNREKQVIHDVYVIVNCKIVPNTTENAGKINFRQSCNRIVSIRKILSVNPPKNVRFHYLPSGQAGGADTINDGAVKFILNEKEAEDYKNRFMKLAFAWRKDYVVPSADREYISDVYVREPELEMYVANTMAERLLIDKKASFKIVPINFWLEEYGKELPEFNDVRFTLLQVLNEKKLKKKNPGHYVYDVR